MTGAEEGVGQASTHVIVDSVFAGGDGEHRAQWYQCGERIERRNCRNKLSNQNSHCHCAQNKTLCHCADYVQWLSSSVRLQR